MLLHILTSANIDCVVIEAGSLVDGIKTSSFQAVVLTEEALRDIPGPALHQALAKQPIWSDIHFIVLTSKGEPLPRVTRLMRMLGDASRCERPVHPADLVAMVRIAIRARRRQYQTRQYLEERQRAEAQIRDLADSLEAQVAERTAALAAEIRERVEAQERMMQMQTELIHVSRLSAMGTMASTLAHELNQPLAAVSNYVSGSIRLLRAGNSVVPTDILEALESAKGNANRAGEIVRRLRELVSRGEVARRPENLRSLIDEALVIAMVDASELGITAAVELEPGTESVVVDKIQIQQVLINLIRNAVDAMHSSSRREVVLSSRKMNSKMTEISVADSGPGLRPEVLETLFSPFVTTKTGGLGIGLSISRTIVESHTGTISGGNRDCGGAVFRFTIPAL